MKTAVSDYRSVQDYKAMPDYNKAVEDYSKNDYALVKRTKRKHVTENKDVLKEQEG